MQIAAAYSKFFFLSFQFNILWFVAYPTLTSTQIILKWLDMFLKKIVFVVSLTLWQACTLTWQQPSNLISPPLRAQHEHTWNGQMDEWVPLLQTVHRPTYMATKNCFNIYPWTWLWLLHDTHNIITYNNRFWTDQPKCPYEDLCIGCR